uniref:Uncharacterized protein n=1 Tax=Knipowitschia caucasica TaxID=637954 RepID=A0AAV2J856_KNICA
MEPWNPRPDGIMEPNTRASPKLMTTGETRQTVPGVLSPVEQTVFSSDDAASLSSSSSPLSLIGSARGPSS